MTDKGKVLLPALAPAQRLTEAPPPQLKNLQSNHDRFQRIVFHEANLAAQYGAVIGTVPTEGLPQYWAHRHWTAGPEKELRLLMSVAVADAISRRDAERAVALILSPYFSHHCMHIPLARKSASLEIGFDVRLHNLCDYVLLADLREIYDALESKNVAHYEILRGAYTALHLKGGYVPHGYRRYPDGEGNMQLLQTYIFSPLVMRSIVARYVQIKVNERIPVDLPPDIVGKFYVDLVHVMFAEKGGHFWRRRPKNFYVDFLCKGLLEKL